jgi:hypothetical protein
MTSETLTCTPRHSLAPPVICLANQAGVHPGQVCARPSRPGGLPAERGASAGRLVLMRGYAAARRLTIPFEGDDVGADAVEELTTVWAIS